MAKRVDLSPTRYMTADDFMLGGKPCPAIRELYKELAAERGGELIDPVVLRRMQDYSSVANLVVGAEGRGPQVFG